MTFYIGVVYAIINFVNYGVNGYLTVYLVDGVLKYEVKRKKIIYPLITAFSALYSGIVSLVHLMQNDPILYMGTVNMFVLGVFIISVTSVFTKTKWWKRIVVLLSACLIISVVDDVFLILRNQISLTFGWNNRNDDNFLTGIYILLSLSIFALQVGFFHLLKRLRSKYDNTPLPVPLVIGIAIMLNVIVLSIMLIYDSYYAQNIQILLLILSMLFILVLVIFFFYMRVARKEREGLRSLNHINEELIASQTKFFESTARSDNEIRAMKHDMRNNIQVLLLLLDNGEYDKMREYLDEMGENLVSADVSAHTGDMIADAIIADKIAEAEAGNLKLRCFGKIDGIRITPVDMCKMLANLLDNAIEAASAPELSELDDSVKVVELQFKKTDNFFMISVTNPSVKAPQIRDGKIVTSKKDEKNHGFGIHNIESAAAVYGGELNVSCDEKPYGYFCRAEIIFPIE